MHRIHDVEENYHTANKKITWKSEIVKNNKENMVHDNDMKLGHKNELLGKDLVISKLKMDHAIVLADIKTKHNSATYKVSKLEDVLKAAKDYINRNSNLTKEWDQLKIAQLKS